MVTMDSAVLLTCRLFDKCSRVLEICFFLVFFLLALLFFLGYVLLGYTYIIAKVSG